MINNRVKGEDCIEIYKTIISFFSNCYSGISNNGVSKQYFYYASYISSIKCYKWVGMLS